VRNSCTLGLRCWHLDKRRQYASVVAGELGWVLEGKEEERVAHSTTRMRVNVVYRGPQAGFEAESGFEVVLVCLKGQERSDVFGLLLNRRPTQPGVGSECTAKKVVGVKATTVRVLV